MDLLMTRGPGTSDLIFENGKCPTTSDRPDRVAQRVIIRLKTFLDEWYLTAGYGVPWLERILGHKVKKSTVDMILLSEIKSVRGVRGVEDFTSSLDILTRDYRCSFRIRTGEGGLSDVITV